MTLKILYADDSKADIALFKIMLQDSSLDYELTTAKDGIEALNLIHQSRPDIIILDLNMPRKRGLEVLQELKSDNRLKAIPVVILTTSENPEHINLSYQYHANAYITKPVDLSKFRDVMNSFSTWWGTTVNLPTQEDL